MKEAKFRIWNKDKRIMSSFGYGSGLSIGESMLVLEHREPFVLMQYTGITDNNGVEICEGDILQGGRVNKAVVHGNPYNNSLTVQYSFKPTEYFVEMDDEFEVIGNIYENPELIKGGA
jgi:uncharacterized phage protein (TIGR01671 family)